MRKTLVLMLALTGVAVATAQVAAVKSDKKPAALPDCFIMGSPIHFNVKADTEQGPVYFCCAGCIAPFQKDMAKYSKEVEAQRAAIAKLPKVQTGCPISGQAISKDSPTVDHNGSKVAFCCAGCKGKFEADPSKYQSKVAASFTYQTKCPISGQPIDPSASVELVNGAKVYACCGTCAGKIKAEPSKYAKKLAAQGYFFKKDELKAK